MARSTPMRNAAPHLTPGQFHRRVMRRIMPVFVLVFLLSIGFVVVITQALGGRDVRQSSRLAATLIQQDVDQAVQAPADEVLRLSTSTITRDYVSLASGVPSSAVSADPAALNRDLARAFNDTLVRYLGRYYRLQLILVDGRVALEARNANGQIQLGGGAALPPQEAAVLFQRMAGVLPGEVYLGTVTASTLDSLGTVLIDAPVARADNPGGILAVVRLEMSAAGLRDALLTGLENASIRRDPRRVLLVNANNEIVLQVGQASAQDDDLLAALENVGAAEVLNLPVANAALVTTSPGVPFAGDATPWRLVIEDQLWAVSWSVNQVTLASAALVVLVAGLLLYALNLALRSQTRPLGEAAKEAAQLASGLANLPGAGKTATPARRAATSYGGVRDTADEVGTVVRSIDGISTYIAELNASLQYQTQRRERDLRIAAQIEQETSGLRDEAALLNRALVIINETLNVTHPQIYLYQPNSDTLALAHSRGRLGRQMITTGIEVAVGDPGLIGQVAAARQAILAADARSTGLDAAHLLPDTRSRLAAPLVAGGQVVGVLDLQSEQLNMFTNEDLPTYTLLANQIASALQAARDYNALEQRLAQPAPVVRALSTARRMVSSEGEYSLSAETAPSGEEAADAAAIHHQPGALSSAITLRGEVIGVLNAAPTDGQSFTEGDAVILGAVAERVALAIENARLFQKTERSLQETSRLYELSRLLNGAENLDEILRAVIDSVMMGVAGGQVWIFDAFATIEQPTWAEVMVDYAVMPRDEDSHDVTGVRLHLPDHPILANMQAHNILLVNDIDRDSRMDELIKYVFRRINGQALVFIPLVVRSEWRGIISLEFPAAREFTETEGRIFTTLIDQAGIAIDNRLLFLQTENALTRNENLYAASRRINDAKTPEDLIKSVVAINQDMALVFSLSLLEGELDETGWPSKARLVARSSGMDALPMDQVYDIHIPIASPMRQREPETVTDIDPSKADVSAPVRWIRSQGYRFAATFPLYNASQPIALFQITSPQLRQFTAEDYEIYRALTGQMSNQLQIRQLLTSTEQALDETRRLYNATNAITRASDSLMVYQAAIEHLSRPLLQYISRNQTLRIAIYLAWPDATPYAPYLECVYHWTTDHDYDSAMMIGQRLSTVDYPFGRLTEDAEGMLYIADVRHNVSTNDLLINEPSLRQMLLDEGVGSMVIAPIQSRMKWFGVITLRSDHAGAFNEQYRRFLQAMTEQISVSVENQRLYEDAQNEARRAQAEAQRAVALNEAAQLANRIGSDFRRSLGDVFERVAEEAGFDRWVLLLKSESGSSLERVTAVAPNYNLEDDFRILDINTELPLVEAVRLNRPLMVNSPRHYPAFQEISPVELELIEARYGKHVVMPVTSIADSTQVLGSLMLGRGITSEDLDDRDEQLASALATQVAVALENRRLFEQTQTEQQRLDSILRSLPAGVLVLDAETLIPVMFNEQAERYLARVIDRAAPFTIEAYDIHRSGTESIYPYAELPIHVALSTGQEDFQDDVAIIREGLRVDLLMNAAPILDTNGDISAIVVAIQDISKLRSLENTLQETLRETVTISEMQRMLSEASELEQVMEVTLLQVSSLGASDAYVVLLEMQAGVRRLHLGRSLYTSLGNEDLPSLNDLLDDGQPVLVPDTHNALLNEQPRELLGMLGMRSYLSLPLRARGGGYPMGWLIAVSEAPDFFTSEQQQQLQKMCDIAVTAIDNRQLIRGQAAALQEAGSLYQVTKTLSRVRDIDQLAPALQDALGYFQPDYVLAFLMPNSEIALMQDWVQLYSQMPDDGLVDEHQAALIDLEAMMRAHHLPDEGVYISDTQMIFEPTPLEFDLLQNGRLQAMAAINLRVKDVEGGWIALAYRQPRRFNDADVRYLNTLADSASIVLDNIALFQQIQGTLEETSVLYQASRALKDAATAQDIVDVIVNFLIQPHINQVFIALLDGRSWDARSVTAAVVASWNQTDTINFLGTVMNAEQFPAWAVLAQEQVLTINDIYDDATLDPLVQVGIQSMDARSLVIIPLRVPKRIIGAIWLSGRDAYHYTDREVRVFQAFAEQASLSLEAAFLLAQTERRARQLETSAQVSQRTGSILDLEVLLPQLVNLILQAFAYDHVQIFLMDNDDEFAELRASTGEAGEQLLAIRHKLRKGSKSVIGQVTATGQPQIALDIADAQVVHQPNPYLPLTRSEMAIPLIIKGEVVGALDVQSNEPNAFTDEDLSVLTTLAAQISVALENARLYEDAQTQADRMSFLFEVTNTAASANRLEDALQEVARRVLETQGAASVTIYLTRLYGDGQGNELRALYAVALAGSDQPLSEVEEVREDNDNHLLGVILREKLPRVIPHLSEDAGYLPVVPQAQSVVLIPLISSNEMIGLIAIEDETPDAFTRDSQQLLFTMARTLSAIVQSSRLLDQLQKSYEQLQELDRLKSDFLANMSHELRTPLNSIIGFSRVMLKGIDGPLTEMQEQDLSTIYNSGQHLLMLINDVLDQAKIAAGKMDIKMAFFDVKPVIEGVKSIGIGLLKDKPIALTVEIANNMPQAYGDEFRIRQVLINLVSNAAKFTREGSVTLRGYPVQHESSGQTMIRIDVVDTGIGIARKDLPLLFEAFQQVDSSLTRTAGGTGLGLPIAKSLVEMQGGEMRVESEVNVGSTFSVLLLTEAPPSEEEAPEPQVYEAVQPLDNDDTHPTLEITKVDLPRLDSTPTTRPEGLPKVYPVGGPSIRMMQTKREVLLIEDNKDMVDQFRRVLQREGFAVQTADHPAYAEAMVSNLRPTLLVMDVNFANGEGWNILKRLKDRDDTFDIPIIVVTLSAEAERAYQAGAHTFIQRPFLPEQLVTAALAAEKDSNTDRILIIDDQSEDVRLLTQLLNENGSYRIFSAASGMEGISLIARRRPNLIILDLRMPEMDGFAVLHELRSNPETAQIPVLVVTGEITLTQAEQDLLAHVHVLQKTDISQEDYEQFLHDVQRHLNGEGNGHAG